MGKILQTQYSCVQQWKDRQERQSDNQDVTLIIPRCLYLQFTTFTVTDRFLFTANEIPRPPSTEIEEKNNKNDCVFISFFLYKT